MAAEYGWTVRRIRSELTDELLLLYVDALVDRVEQDHEDRFDALVNATRLGVVFAHEPKHFATWNRRRKRQRGQAVGLTGAALEAAVSSWQMTMPMYIVEGPR